MADGYSTSAVANEGGDDARPRSMSDLRTSLFGSSGLKTRRASTAYFPPPESVLVCKSEQDVDGSTRSGVTSDTESEPEDPPSFVHQEQSETSAVSEAHEAAQPVTVKWMYADVGVLPGQNTIAYYLSTARWSKHLSSDDFEVDLRQAPPTEKGRSIYLCYYDSEGKELTNYRKECKSGVDEAIETISKSLRQAPKRPTKGLVWHAKVMTDDFEGEIKPKRPMPQIKVSDLYANLHRVNGKWIYKGELNGWPALVGLELQSLTYCSGILKNVTRFWSAGDGAEAPELPAKAKIPKRTRATFISPSWSSIGWSADSPGFCWWYSLHKDATNWELHFGEKMMDFLSQGTRGNAWATKAHAFCHRYPVKGDETFKDRQTWHAGVVVEWTHGEYTTLIELAYLNGCSGYNGRSNWCKDKLETPTKLDQAMPASMKAPWDCGKSEIRIYDMKLKDQKELRAYLHEWSAENSAAGKLPQEEVRFVEPVIFGSGDVRIRRCTPAQLMGFILNYIHRAWAYIEWEPKRASNCQTFAADLFSFLTGKRDFKPYVPLIAGVYNQRSFSFLYEPGR